MILHPGVKSGTLFCTQNIVFVELLKGISVLTRGDFLSVISEVNDSGLFVRKLALNATSRRLTCLQHLLALTSYQILYMLYLVFLKLNRI